MCQHSRDVSPAIPTVVDIAAAAATFPAATPADPWRSSLSDPDSGGDTDASDAGTDETDAKPSSPSHSPAPSAANAPSFAASSFTFTPALPFATAPLTAAPLPAAPDLSFADIVAADALPAIATWAANPAWADDPGAGWLTASAGWATNFAQLTIILGAVPFLGGAALSTEQMWALFCHARGHPRTAANFFFWPSTAVGELSPPWYTAHATLAAHSAARPAALSALPTPAFPLPSAVASLAATASAAPPATAHLGYMAGCGEVPQ